MVGTVVWAPWEPERNHPPPPSYLPFPRKGKQEFEFSFFFTLRGGNREKERKKKSFLPSFDRTEGRIGPQKEKKKGGKFFFGLLLSPLPLPPPPQPKGKKEKVEGEKKFPPPPVLPASSVS